MFRFRHHQRIRPARARLSRRRLAATTVVGLVALAVLATSLAGRSHLRSIELGDAPSYRVASTAGPVEVVAAATARLDYRASWLGRGPTIGSGQPAGPSTAAWLQPGGVAPARPVGVSVDCDTRWPCRASAVLQVPAEAGLEASGLGGPVVIGARSGPVVVTTVDDDVFIGPVDGDLTVDTDAGRVVGTGLASPTVVVRAGTGRVELRFRERPRSVTVEAGTASVLIELPPGDYAVSVVGSPTATIEVERDQQADSLISVGGLGPVQIVSAPDHPTTEQRPEGQPANGQRPPEQPTT